MIPAALCVACPLDRERTLNHESVKTPTRSTASALADGLYGLCAWEADNNQPDWQNVEIDFRDENKERRVSFKLRSGGGVMTREIDVYFERGCLKGDLASGKLVKTIYGAGRYGNRSEEISLDVGGGHGGGDSRLLRGFYNAIVNGDSTRTGARESLESHLLAFAADKSANTEGEDIDFSKYKAGVGV